MAESARLHDELAHAHLPLMDSDHGTHAVCDLVMSGQFTHPDCEDEDLGMLLG